MNVAYKEKEKSEWGTWSSLDLEYRNSLRSVNNYRKDETDIAMIEIASGMKNDLKSSIGEIKKRMLYEFQTLNEEDLKEIGLTDRQIQIGLLRQSYNCKDISNMLEVAESTVFNIYSNVVNKITRHNESKTKVKNLHKLSNQQLLIYNLKRQGKKDKEIADDLGIKLGTLKTHKKRIKEKLGSTNS